MLMLSSLRVGHCMPFTISSAMLKLVLTKRQTWCASNLAPTYKRGAGVAFLIGMGNFSGPMAANFYR